jgi:hypothetical protein
MVTIDPIEGYLRTILDRVDTWLRFAEVKNGGLIAVTATVSTALVGALRNTSDLSPLVAGLFTLAIVLFLLAMAVGLYSYLPRLRPETVRAGAGRDPAEGDNLFFYGDLAQHAPEDLARAVARRYGDADAAATTIPAAQLDLAAQIAVNSRITVRKLRLFNVGGALALVAAVAYSMAMITRLVGL